MGKIKCPLIRNANKYQKFNNISSSLRKNFVNLAIKESFKFFSNFFNDKSIKEYNFKLLTNEYCRIIKNAYDFNLFKVGGISEKDFLLLWCFHKYFNADNYIESGVYIGSSLYAAISGTQNAKIIGIDPNLKNLKLPKDLIAKCKLINDKDFSEINFTEINKKKSVVFFDDHINAADRIIESFNKGFKYLIFDDANGFEGISQRLYPAFPSIPIIMNSNLISTNDAFHWIYKQRIIEKDVFPNKLNILKQIYKIIKGNNSTLVRAEFNEKLLEKCLFAKSLIQRSIILPDLGDYILPTNPLNISINQRKYLIQLNQK